MDVEEEEPEFEELPVYEENDLSVLDSEQIKKDISILEAERNKLV
jgi:hypothetical protein